MDTDTVSVDIYYSLQLEYKELKDKFNKLQTDYDIRGKALSLAYDKIDKLRIDVEVEKKYHNKDIELAEAFREFCSEHNL